MGLGTGARSHTRRPLGGDQSRAMERNKAPHTMRDSPVGGGQSRVRHRSKAPCRVALWEENTEAGERRGGSCSWLGNSDAN